MSPFRTFILLAFALGTHLAQGQESAPRVRTAYEKLTGATKQQFDKCEAIEREIAGTLGRDARLPLAADLFEASAALVKEDRNIFRGWLWQALTALLLDKKNEGMKAIIELVALGAADSKNAQVMRIIQQANGRGWLAGLDATAAPQPNETVNGTDTSDPRQADAAHRYEGTIANGDAIFELQWGEGDRVTGSYRYTEQTETTVYSLRGKNPEAGKLDFEVFTNLEKAGELRLAKRVTDDSVLWEGQLIHMDGKEFPVEMHRPRVPQQ